METPNANSKELNHVAVQAFALSISERFGTITASPEISVDYDAVDAHGAKFLPGQGELTTANRDLVSCIPKMTDGLAN